MCLAVAGELIRIEQRQPPGPVPGSPAHDPELWRVGVVDFRGVQREVSLACVPEARLGDRLLVHVGFALSIVRDEDPGPATGAELEP